ncbi:MAG: LysR family transcriptional regulator [Arenibacterium sp.]
MAVTPRRPKGPALNAMRAFEAAARLSSFVAAAEELGVTPGAISQHVKTLEDWAGTTLFTRRAQGIELTPAGEGVKAEFETAFDAIARATYALRNLSQAADIHIAALPSVAQLWLPPRLVAIRKAFPSNRFSVTALETPPSLRRDLFDLSVFFSGEPPGPDQIVLADDLMTPVCAPALAARIKDDSDVQNQTLLHDQTWSEDWAIWSKSRDLAMRNVASGPRFSLYGLAVEEAKAGAGVLMGHVCLIDPALRRGELVRLSNIDVASGRKLVLSLPHPSVRRPEINAICERLMDFDVAD